MTRLDKHWLIPASMFLFALALVAPFLASCDESNLPPASTTHTQKAHTPNAGGSFQSDPELAGMLQAEIFYIVDVFGGREKPARVKYGETGSNRIQAITFGGVVTVHEWVKSWDSSAKRKLMQHEAVHVVHPGGHPEHINGIRVADHVAWWTPDKCEACGHE